MAHNLDGNAAQKVVFVVAEGLRGSHHNAFAGMDAERVEIFHIADRDTVVVTVANYLVFNLFPTFKRFFDKDLGRIRKGRFGKAAEFVVVGTETRTETAESVRSTHNHGVADFADNIQSLVDIVDSHALSSFYANAVHHFGKQFSVFGVDNRLNGSTEHLDIIFF